jgi:hypothetical protein
MALEGGCQCGAVRYRVEGEPVHGALCHCRDCQQSSGAPVVAWTAFPAERFELIAGAATVFNSSGSAMRHFCPICGTGVYYTNEAVLPGLVDIQTATLDSPEALAPQVQIQTAERIGWMTELADLPEFERYPGG